jgi:hypothetical protein
MIILFLELVHRSRSSCHLSRMPAAGDHLAQEQVGFACRTSLPASAIASREFTGPGRALNLVFAALDVAVV